MHLWVAVKHAPLSLSRDPQTHVSKWRLDRCWLLPSFLRWRYANHLELVVTRACTRDCPLCSQLPRSVASEHFQSKHYLTYSVDHKHARVFRSTNRHIVAPVSPQENDEEWCYYKIPISQRAVWNAFLFLEAQINKPIRSNYAWNFYFLCCSNGLRLSDEDFLNNDAWSCSELTSAVLILHWAEYATDNVRDPCLSTPCSVESQIRDLAGVLEFSQLLFRPVLASS